MPSESIQTPSLFQHFVTLQPYSKMDKKNICIPIQSLTDKSPVVGIRPTDWSTFTCDKVSKGHHCIWNAFAAEMDSTRKIIWHNLATTPSGHAWWCSPGMNSSFCILFIMAESYCQGRIKAVYAVLKHYNTFTDFTTHCVPSGHFSTTTTYLQYKIHVYMYV